MKESAKYPSLVVFQWIMRVLLVISLSLTSLWTVAQSITITGKVQDKVTGEALPFASVGIKGKTLSTVTNLQGEFDFHLPADYRNEILVISMLGYSSYEAPVWSHLSNELQLIRMDKSTLLLQEVTVSDSLSAGELFSIAWSSIEKNFAMEPFLLDGFYRDIKKVGGTHISLLEAAVQIYDENYKEPRNKFKLREHVKLVEVRRSLGYENKFTSFFDQYNLLEDLLLHNDVRYRKMELDNEFLNDMKREKDSYYNGHEIYVVSHKDHNLSQRIFIDKQDYSIIHADYEMQATNEIVEKRNGMISRFAGLTKSIDFRRFEEKMHLNFMTMTSKVNWYDGKSEKLRFETELYQELLINNVHSNSPERISSNEKMRNYGLQYQDLPYNKQFWDNYNVIKETPLDKTILSDLEKALPLDKQFEYTVEEEDGSLK